MKLAPPPTGAWRANPQRSSDPDHRSRAPLRTELQVRCPWAYDNAGNITTDGAGSLFTFDAENRLLTGGGATYDYDGDGRRVRKTKGPDQTFFLYDASGNLAAEYATAAPAPSCTTCYLFTDHLGSARLILTATGAPVARTDYAPFGEELLASTGSPRLAVSGYSADAKVKQKFTGKERDAETGLDYFGARYMSAVGGRFTSPDPKLFPESLDDSQSWNKYGYTRNNPLRFVDPDGEDWLDVVHGTVDAFVSNNQPVISTRSSGGNADFKTGQAIGDGLSAIQGLGEVLFGAGGEVAGTVLDATGVGAVVGVPAQVVSTGVIVHGGTIATRAGGNLVKAAFARGKEPGPTVDPTSGQEVGRFVGDQKGNVMAEPKGGKTVPAGKGGADTHTLYPNGSNAQRLNPQGHANNPTPHGHGHLPGTGPGKKGQGPSLSPEGKVVKPNTKEAHWPIN